MPSGNRKPFQGFNSIASYVYYCLEKDPPITRDEIIKPLLEAGYTRHRALTLYRNNLTRYRDRRIAILAKEGVVPG
jgi:hypothetical protein